MSEIAIQVENISKLYQIGRAQVQHDTLRDALVDRLKQLGRRQPPDDPGNHIWALKDVSFDVQQGEVMGIVGRNGAGKSTLLKILSRITDPTEGRALIHGRVASLLEVGTGFHPELTGRENIYLNGAILGMRREEIARKFDEIVTFAEVEKFLDTPVKRYSSGMYVRLAFAVAAHLEPEILVVDEVLAVGDAGFQKKCLGKMEEVSQGGRTVLFVSHNMAAIEALCNRCVALINGRVTHIGPSTEVVRKYLSRVADTGRSLGLGQRADRVGSGQVRYTEVRFLDQTEQEITQVAMGEPLTIEARFEVYEPIREPIFGFLITNEMSQTVLRAYSRESYHGPTPNLDKSGLVRCHFPHLPLMYGQYTLRLWLGHHRNNVVDDIEFTATFDVLQRDVYETGIPPDANNGGSFYLPHEWDIVQAG
jgi:lipopolysaccharide transport system ATP-binding protein